MNLSFSLTNLAGLLSCLVAIHPSGWANAQDGLFTEAAAVLERRCVQCHNSQDSKGGLSLQTRHDILTGGDSGAAMSFKEGEISLLLDMIGGDSPEMPKGGSKLSHVEIAAIRNWIEAGARWPEGRILTNQSLSDTHWWSLQPLSRPDLPESNGNAQLQAAGPIDRFILAKLHERGLNHSPEADRRALIRRVTYDLIGLPPTMEEVDAFCNDPDPKAYERWVERLLESPRYGERWARHWLDVVHYGETHGYDKDQPRPNAWPYRDYVIRAFNQDKPFSRFVQEQIAGDVLFPNTEDGITALGFIAAGPWDLIGHAEVPESKIDGKIARHLDRDDMVSNTINTFQSITVHCAQCHDHKFDPIAQEDYYALQANFAALDRADRWYDKDPNVAQQRASLMAEKNALQATLDAFAAKAKSSGGEAIAALDQLIESARKPATSLAERFGWHSTIESSQEVPKWVQVDLGSSLTFQRVVLHPCHDDFNGIGQGFGFPVRFKVEASDDPDFADNAVLLADQTAHDFPNPGLAAVSHDVQATARYVRITATKLAPRQNDYIFALAELAVVDSSGKNVAGHASVHAQDGIDAPPRWQSVNLTDGWYPGVDASKLPSQADEVRKLEESRRLLWEALLGTNAVAEWEAAQHEQLELEQKLAELPSQSKIYCGTVYTGSGNFAGTGSSGGQPRQVAVLARGDVRTPLAESVPGTLRFFPSLTARFQLDASEGEGQRRAALALWLSDPRNPLTWRSIVNRVWQYHFGRGLVETPNDFGRMGAEPTHPELLDWLAIWFRDETQGSLKRLHQLIVTSQTYRQSSTADVALQQRAGVLDDANSLLWRQNRRRLEAEAIRDSILNAAGKLDLTMGGPSFQDFVVTHPEHSPHYEYHLADYDDPKLHRRSVYRFIVRSQQQPWMATLDCADPSVLVDKRNQTITALQALAQLNNQLILVMSRHFASRVSGESDEPVEQVKSAFRLALQRNPTASELEDLSSYAEHHGMANACRVLLNLNEFVFVD